MIKNIIFDLGNVLVSVNKEPVRKLFSKLTKRNIEFLEDLFSEINRGTIQLRELFQKIQTHNFFKNQLDYEEFEKTWCSIFEPDWEMIHWGKQLSKEYTVYLLSNTDHLHFTYIWQTWPEIDFFQGIGLSYELKEIKPDLKIYQKFLSHFSLHAAECIFIDDLQENIHGAEKAGIKGIVHKDFQSTKKNLFNFL